MWTTSKLRGKPPVSAPTTATVAQDFLALRSASTDQSQNRYAGFHSECRARGLADPVLIELSEKDATTPDKFAELLRQQKT